MLQERIEGKWIDCFARVFARCRVEPGEPVAILSETQSRGINVQLAELALHQLRAKPFHVVVPTPAQSVKVHRERRERDLAIAAVAGDEQRMRAAYAERIGAGERRRSRAAKVWTALAHARGVCWSAPRMEQSSCCAARLRQRHALEPICRQTASSGQQLACREDSRRPV